MPVQAYMKEHPNVTIELQGTSSDDQIRNIKMAAQNGHFLNCSGWSREAR